MSRHIDADALKEKAKWYNIYSDKPPHSIRAVTTQEIDWMPTIEPERKTGRWMWSSDEYGESWICSECMAEYSDFEGFKDEAKYCPNCGADLREGAEQE